MTDDPIEARFAMLRRVGGDKLIAELLELFFETTPKRLAAARAGAAAGDLVAVARAGHSLTSSAGNLGCAGLQGLSLELEERSRADDAAAIAALLPRLDAAWEEARSALAARKELLQP